jgi:NAD(P)-dependent dehydrogenase (short-subunit alcohol dehydrogenase family)
MAGKLAGKVAIITGSGQSVGRDVALCMAKEGARIITLFGDTGDEGQHQGRCHCPPFIIASSGHP